MKPQYPQSSQYPQYQPSWNKQPNLSFPPPSIQQNQPYPQQRSESENSYNVFDPSSYSEVNNPWTSSAWSHEYKVQPTSHAIPNVFKFESLLQFQRLRNHTTIESSLFQLKELATDLSEVNPKSFVPDASSCFIICNSYKRKEFSLGVGPVNDAITVAANHRFMGYKVYFLHDSSYQIFLDFLKVFLRKTNQFLTVYYTGHGGQIEDFSGDEQDGLDEAIVFDDGFVIDDTLADYLKKYHNGKSHTVLMSDCCHSGTIWDLPENVEQAELEFPPNIITLAASKDNQTAKQADIENNAQGVFTFLFFTVIRNNPYALIDEIKKIIDPKTGKFEQHLEVHSTSADMMSKPLFPKLINK